VCDHILQFVSTKFGLDLPNDPQKHWPYLIKNYPSLDDVFVNTWTEHVAKLPIRSAIPTELTSRVDFLVQQAKEGKVVLNCWKMVLARLTSQACHTSGARSEKLQRIPGIHCDGADRPVVLV
jgi:hypothetical protein